MSALDARAPSHLSTATSWTDSRGPKMLKRMPIRPMACAALAASNLRTVGASASAARLSTKPSELDELKFLVGDRSIGSLYDFEAANAAGEMVPMSAYEGKAVLIVNVASL